MEKPNLESEKAETMSPRDGDDCEPKQNGVNDELALEEDLNELEAVNESLDYLNTALDNLEKATDNIKAKIMELLTSNKEARESFVKENNDIANN